MRIVEPVTTSDKSAVSSRRPVTVIVNADDFGMNARETDAICEGLASGRITSATVMANGAALPNVLRHIGNFQSCSFGVHLNATQGVPLSRGSTARVLVNQDGRMSRKVLLALRPTPAVLRAVYTEWCAQVEHLTAGGIALSHLDSHNHVHTLPHLLPVLKAVQRRFGIRRVRISKNIYRVSDTCSALKRCEKWLYNSAVRAFYATRTAGGFTDLVTFYDVAREGRLRHSIVEIMVHPASKGNEMEDQLLNSDWARDLPMPIVKIPYSKL
jgi:predicted glycoside hydrolase/deacetylase ChbG (UPF0249 family)